MLCGSLQQRDDELQELVRIHRLDDVLLEASRQGPIAVRWSRIGGQRQRRNLRKHRSDSRH